MPINYKKSAVIAALALGISGCKTISALKLVGTFDSGLGEGAAEIERTGMKAFWQSFGVLGTTVKEAPEFEARRRRTAQ